MISPEKSEAIRDYLNFVRDKKAKQLRELVID